MGLRLLLHIDLWQSCKLGISGMGCSKWWLENKRCVGVSRSHGLTAERMTRTRRCYEITHTHTHPCTYSHSQSHNKVRAEARLCVTHGGEQLPQCTLVENLSSGKQRRKALNMESQHKLRKGQYSSPSPVCVRLLSPCLDLSHL